MLIRILKITTIFGLVFIMHGCKGSQELGHANHSSGVSNGDLTIRYTYDGSGIGPGSHVRVIDVGAENRMVSRVILEVLQDEGFSLSNLELGTIDLLPQKLYKTEITQLHDELIQQYNLSEPSQLPTIYYYGLSIGVKYNINTVNQEVSVNVHVSLNKRGSGSNWSTYNDDYNIQFFGKYITNLMADKLNQLYPLPVHD